MKTYRLGVRLGGAGIVSIFLAAGCGPVTPNSGALTAEDAAALGSASRSLHGLGQAASLAYAVATSQAAPAKAVEGTTSVEGCPVITISPGQGTAFNFSINFGAGCPLPGQETPVCSGAAAGQLDPPSNQLNLSFMALSCTDIPTLDGSIAVTYNLADSVITLDGTWDLTFTTETEQNGITGQGLITLDSSTQIVTINQFTGQLTLGGDVWNITVDSVQISLTDNEERLPFAGTIQLDGGLFRQFTVEFTEDTPSTGVVNVGVLNGLFFFPLDLDTLNL